MRRSTKICTCVCHNRITVRHTAEETTETGAYIDLVPSLSDVKSLFLLQSVVLYISKLLGLFCPSTVATANIEVIFTE